MPSPPLCIGAPSLAIPPRHASSRHGLGAKLQAACRLHRWWLIEASSSKTCELVESGRSGLQSSSVGAGKHSCQSAESGRGRIGCKACGPRHRGGMEIELAGDKEKMKKARVDDIVRRGGTIHELMSAYRPTKGPVLRSFSRCI